VRTMNISLFYMDDIRGIDYTALGGSRIGNKPLTPIEWENTSFGLKGSFQVINDVYVWASFIHSNMWGNPAWTPDMMQGIKNTVNAGMTIGF
jgi:hypothetical protein